MANKPRRRTKPPSKIPGTFKDFITRYPDLGAAHERIAAAVEKAGPLDARTLALIKIGVCLGAGLESALRSHVRRALQHGATRPEIEQAILLGMNTVGFPRTVAAWAWAGEQFKRGKVESATGRLRSMRAPRHARSEGQLRATTGRG